MSIRLIISSHCHRRRPSPQPQPSPCLLRRDGDGQARLLFACCLLFVVVAATMRRSDEDSNSTPTQKHSSMIDQLFTPQHNIIISHLATMMRFIIILSQYTRYDNDKFKNSLITFLINSKHELSAPLLLLTTFVHHIPYRFTTNIRFNILRSHIHKTLSCL